MFKAKILRGVAFGALLTAISATSVAHAQQRPHTSTTSTQTAYVETRAAPLWGEISPFWGEISPFWGEISPFWGEISPFWGEISPFWGEISPFWGEISPFWGEISPFWGEIAPFWGEISPFMSTTVTQWSSISGSPTRTDVERLRQNLQSIIAQSESFWGASVQAQTGQSFSQAFTAPMLARFGIDLGNNGNLSGVSSQTLQRFLLAWQDGLMQYSGRNQIDYWMALTHWSPALTQTQGSGVDTIIGLIDMATPRTESLSGNVISYDGFSDTLNGHGGAVASLLVGQHDGQGVMGIAPRASVALYNPFDSTGTASWSDVAQGIVAVTNAGASVVNMSLGVPGYTLHPDWAQVYASANVAPVLDSTVFVHAAGNDGLAQTSNVNWGAASAANLIIVGSIGPNGAISSFSNTPGNACLMVGSVCDRLMNHFIVAPGENILVSDNNGGVTRMSGTSLAAPQVSGAIALLHDRWAWLSDHPDETIDIIFRSAQDLGAPGVDAIFGHGLLDIQASQSPLRFADLYYYEVKNNGDLLRRRLDSNGARNSNQIWKTRNGYFIAFEDIGDTYRDFLIPMDANLVGQTGAINGRSEMFQWYLHDAFVDWAGGFVEERSALTQSGARLSLRAAPLREVQDGDFPFAVDTSLQANNGWSMRFGNGFGAAVLMHGDERASVRNDSARTGANPILSLASGDAYVGLARALPGGGSIGFGLTQNHDEAVFADPVSGEVTPIFAGLDAYEAQAAHVSLTLPLSGAVDLSASYTLLHESNALLGVQSRNRSDFAAGAQTDALGLAATWRPNQRLALSVGAMAARTRAQEAGSQALAVGDAGVLSSAFEAMLDINGVWGRQDEARARIYQPLYLEAGALNVAHVEVVDRATGELGVVTQRVDLDGGVRPLMLEGLYGAPILEGGGRLEAFFNVNLADGASSDASADLVGVRVGLSF